MAGMTAPKPFISLRNVRKVYRSGGSEFLAVSDVTMDVQEGELISLVGPSGCGKTTVLKILAGMQQRTAIARAFVHDPKLILMDEPFGALDALTREQMNLEMLRIWRDSGKTIIFVTHSIQEAVFLASHCAVLTAGPARMAEYFSIDLPFPRALPIKTTDQFGAYARRIYESLGLGAAA